MSAKETATATHGFENPFHSYAETTNESLKEFWGWQVKAGQSFFDQGLRYAQTYADFVQTQLQEGTRLSQEFIKIGLANAGEMKKTFSSVSK